MTDTSFWIAIAGLLATIIVSSVGFYYAHRAQRSPLRELLHEKQIEILMEFSVACTRLQKAAATLLTPNLTKDDQDELDRIWDEISYNVLDIAQRGAVVLPASLYSAMTAFRVCAEDFEIAVVKSGETESAYYALMGAASHVVMLGRELSGADGLSVESLNLHNKSGYRKMNNIGRVALGRVSRALWNRGRTEDDDA